MEKLAAFRAEIIMTGQTRAFAERSGGVWKVLSISAGRFTSINTLLRLKFWFEVKIFQCMVRKVSDLHSAQAPYLSVILFS